MIELTYLQAIVAAEVVLDIGVVAGAVITVILEHYFEGNDRAKDHEKRLRKLEKWKKQSKTCKSKGPSTARTCDRV